MSDNLRLKDYLLPQRIERLREVLANRTVSVTIVLENLHKDHNISAILRTCESFGIQNVHVVPQRGEGKVFRTVTQGCHKWLTVHRHLSVSDCLKSLKAKGFRILAGAFGDGALPLERIDFSGRMALVFSNELEGASTDVLEQVDGIFIIPMVGFSRSLNVSVAAGIAIHHIFKYKRGKGEELERIPAEEAGVLLEDWVKKSVRNADSILKEIRSRKC